MENELNDARVQIVAPKSWVDMVDSWCKKHPEKISRSEAIRIAAEQMFSTKSAA